MPGRSVAGCLLGILCLSAVAQAPSTPGPTSGQAVTPLTAEETRAGGNAARAPAARSAGGRTSFTPPPMNIRIQEEGVKLPKCTAESREGEACKK